MSVEIVPMAVQTTAIEGLLVITTKAVTDDRGTVREFFRTSGFAEAGVPVPDRWAQVNMTWTHQGGLRGLHAEAMTKLVGVAAGEAFGAYADARPDSPTRGASVTVPLTVGTQVLVPQGVANGFQAVSEGGCQYVYLFDAEWVPGMAGVGITPLDPDLAIAWPITPAVDDPSMVSAKDASAPPLAQVLAR